MLNWTQKTPYLNMGMMEHECKGLIDTGSTLPLISLNLANTIEQSKVWTKQHELQLCYWNKKVNIKAIGCDKKPLKMHGIMTVPELTLNSQKLGVTASFWLMQDATDEIILSADWMRQLRAKIDFHTQGFIYSLPKTNLYPDNVLIQLKPKFIDDTPTDPEKDNNEIIDNKICKITIKGLHIIKPFRATTITLSKDQGQKISKVCTEINKADTYKRDEMKEKQSSKQDMSKSLYLPPLDPPDITQPITVNGMPGLLCKQQKGNKYVRLIIPSVSVTAIKLQQNLHIKPREPPKFFIARTEKRQEYSRTKSYADWT